MTTQTSVMDAAAPRSARTVTPMVSIGLPVYNGEAFLSRALDSLLAQTHEDFGLTISDNDSSDGTRDICDRYARRDERIRYVRQAENIGAPRNFKFVLDRATSPFFMWAAHDDYWDPDYIRENLAAIQADPTLVCSVSKALFLWDSGQPELMYMGTSPLRGSPAERLETYLCRPGPVANSRWYGLFRTEVLQASFDESYDFWGFDWAVMARTLTYGHHHELDRCLLWRRWRGPPVDAAAMVARHNSTLAGRCTSLWPFARAMLADPRICRTWRLRWRLLRYQRPIRTVWRMLRAKIRGFPS